jgi:transcriptional regulator with XRE-family HTH domain
MNTKDMTQAERHKFIMKLKGITEADLVRLIPLNKTSVYRVCSGETEDPKLSNAAMYAKALGVSLDVYAGRKKLRL